MYNSDCPLAVINLHRRSSLPSQVQSLRLHCPTSLLIGWMSHIFDTHWEVCRDSLGRRSTQQGQPKIRSTAVQEAIVLRPESRTGVTSGQILLWISIHVPFLRLIDAFTHEASNMTTGTAYVALPMHGCLPAEICAAP